MQNFKQKDSKQFLLKKSGSFVLQLRVKKLFDGADFVYFVLKKGYSNINNSLNLFAYCRFFLQST